MQSRLAELVRRYDRPGPRYTSYPTALEFHEGVAREAYEAYLDRAGTRTDPLSFYIHLPFCEERCLFCGCNVVVTKRHDLADRYLDFLEREIRSVAARLGGHRPLAQYHWGGGTPSYLAPEQMRRLHGLVAELFPFEEDAEVAIELDPRVTTRDHLETLKELGFNRLSIGVQDFTPEVQEEVRRVQPFALTKQLVDDARGLGFHSLNLDLIYGLPRQTPETFRKSVELVLALRPDRLAIYSYAHVPWLKGHQRKLDASLLPSPDTKLELFLTAASLLREAGYVSLGMDHFALPTDELGRAAQDGRLWRNFMGYTLKSAPDMIACGLSGIGDVEGTFFQNHRKLHAYEAAVEETGLGIERGYVPTDDDRLRRYVITKLMCTFRLDFHDVEGRFGVPFRVYFEKDLAELGGLAQDGLVEVGDDAIVVPEQGRLFIRNICMAFDAHLRAKSADRPRWSRTV